MELNKNPLSWALIIIALSVAYYFVIYLPKVSQAKIIQAKQELAIKNQQQCRKDGEKLLQEDKDTATRKKSDRGTLNCYYMEAAFIYNDSLNTCLYSGGYSCELNKLYPNGIFKGSPVSKWTRHIIDVYSNKTLEQTSVNDSSAVSDWESKSIDDFWEKSREYGF